MVQIQLHFQLANCVIRGQNIDRPARSRVFIRYSCQPLRRQHSLHGWMNSELITRKWKPSTHQQTRVVGFVSASLSD